MPDSVMAFAFLGELVCVVGLIWMGDRELWRWARKTPVAQPDAHADLMRKYNCLMSDAECDEMHSERWMGE